MKVLAVIPARSGSKGIPHKNIRPFRGKPLMAWSIEQARASKLVTRTIVSTESEEYAAIAREHGAEVPFLRPAELAQDLSSDLETFQHALRWLAEHESYVPDLVVHLRPTYPTREARDIDAAIKALSERPEFDSVRSIAPAPATPFKMWTRADDGTLAPVTSDIGVPEPWNQARQALPQVYLQNACIDVVRAKVILEQNSMSGRRIFGYPMEHNFDIDSELDFHEATLAAAESAAGPKVFCFDIDGVIAQQQKPTEYDKAGPIAENIAVVNQLYDAGHHIVLFTARGTKTGMDWSEVTRQQMERWGVRYHELKFGKPAADYYIDDKAMLPASIAGLPVRYCRAKDNKGS